MLYRPSQAILHCGSTNRLIRVSSQTSSRKKTRWIEHTWWIPPRATMRVSRAAKSLKTHFYLFRPFTHVAHSNLHAPTRLLEPAASCIVESFKIFMRHDSPSRSFERYRHRNWGKYTLLNDESANFEESQIRRRRTNNLLLIKNV